MARDHERSLKDDGHAPKQSIVERHVHNEERGNTHTHTVT